MATRIDFLKAEVRRLSPSAFAKFATWVYSEASKRDYEALADDTNGIAYKDVLRIFEREFRISRRKPQLLSGGSGGACMAFFYERTRVRGCSFNNDADMLLVEWGPQDSGEFRVAYTRQLIPPLPNGRDEIWQLTLDMRFTDVKQLQKLSSGSRWFRSLRDHEKLLLFIGSSRVGCAIENEKPVRVLLSYENVE